MKPKRIIPLRAKPATFLLLGAAYLLIGGFVIDKMNDALPWWAVAIYAVLLSGSLLVSVADLTSYWRDREIEAWVYEAFPLDTELHARMRHDLIHGNDEFKEQDDPDRRPLTPLSGFYIYPESEADRERLRELRGALEKERRRASR